jgi:DNA-binding transcriptional ArsR family regulator
MPDRAQLESIAGMFKAFADATRLQLIQALRYGPKNVGQLVEELDLTQANVSKHLQTLFDARILSREKRGTATFYAIDDQFIFPLCELVCDKINRNNTRVTTVGFGSPDFSI